MKDGKYNRYKYIEKVLFSYLSNVEKRADYISALEYINTHGDVRVQTYEEGTAGGDVTDRVLDYVHKKHLLEKKLERLNIETESVGSLIEFLERRADSHASKLSAVLQCIYLQGRSGPIPGVPEDEIPELRHELVNRVSSRMKRYAERHSR